MKHDHPFPHDVACDGCVKEIVEEERENLRARRWRRVWLLVLVAVAIVEMAMLSWWLRKG